MRPDGFKRETIVFLWFLVTFGLIGALSWTFPHLGWLIFGVGAFVSALYATLAQYALARRFFSKWVKGEGKAIFITGCDSGFGHLLAKRLDQFGFKVLAGCQFPDGGGAAVLKAECSSRLHVIHIDITQQDSVDAAYKEVANSLNGHVFWALVNNAGIGYYSNIEWTQTSGFQRMLDINTMGQVRVTLKFLPLVREHQARLVFTGSMAGEFTYPGLVAYAMSKHAILSFSNGLRSEMQVWGVKVSIVMPNLYRTPMSDINVLMSTMQKTFDSSPQHIQESYGTGYLQSVKKSLNFVYWLSRPNMMEVVHNLEDAVMSTEPKMSYPCGGMPDWVMIMGLRFAPLGLHQFFIDAVMLPWDRPKGVLDRAENTEKKKVC